jgi:hypothetical protein
MKKIKKFSGLLFTLVLILTIIAVGLIGTYISLNLLP